MTGWLYFCVGTFLYLLIDYSNLMLCGTDIIELFIITAVGMHEWLYAFEINF